jgi:hypothetical protein
MQDLLSAIVLGLSFGNLWICVVLVFTLQQTNRRTCTGYLIGRFAAIIVFSLAICMAGRFFSIDKKSLHILSGGLLILISTYFFLTRVLNIRLNLKVAQSSLPKPTNQNHNECGHDCKTCPAMQAEEYKSMCSSCHTTLCEAEQPEVEALTRTSRTIWNKASRPGHDGGFLAGVSLGAVRGVALCNKLIVMVPILMTATIAKATVVSAGFALSSSVYPLLGLLFGGIALRFIRYKKALFIVSCSLMVVLGLRYLLLGIIG